MRKFIKGQCLEALRLLEEAHFEIEKNMENGQADPAMGLLGQCQESAISIGSIIESS